MSDNLSNFYGAMSACGIAQLFKFKQNMLSAEESRARLPSSSVSFLTAAAVWRHADNIDILIKTSSVWSGPEMNGLMLAWGSC